MLAGDVLNRSLFLQKFSVIDNCQDRKYAYTHQVHES